MRIIDIIELLKEYLLLGMAVVIFLVAFFTIGYFVIYKKVLNGKKSISGKKLTLTALLCCYFVVVFGATFGSRGGWYQGSVNLHLFSSYREAWNNFSSIEWRNIILNICLFIPLGFLLPLFSNVFKKFWTTYLAGFVLTVVIECILTCKITSEGVVSGYRNNLIRYEEYKEYEIISEQQAFQQLKEGKVNFRYLIDDVENIFVKNIRLGYSLDTKGYYQPVYIFQTRLNDEEAEIAIPALK